MHALVCAFALAALADVPTPLDYFDARQMLDCPQVLAWAKPTANVGRAAVEIAVSEGWCDRYEFDACDGPAACVGYAADCRAFCAGCGPDLSPDERATLQVRLREANRVIAHLETRAVLEPDRAEELLTYCGWLKERRAPVATLFAWPTCLRCYRLKAAAAFRASGSDGVIVPASYYRPMSR